MYRNVYFIVVKKNFIIYVNVFVDNLKWISVLEVICNGFVYDYVVLSVLCIGFGGVINFFGICD